MFDRRSFLLKAGWGTWALLDSTFTNRRLLVRPQSQGRLDRSDVRSVIMHVVPWLPPGKQAPPEPGLSNSTLPQTGDTARNYEIHLSAMRAAGVDIVTLDVQARTGWQPGAGLDTAIWQQGHAELWMAAMRKVAPGMRFCFCLDRVSDQITNAQQWPAVIDALLTAYGNDQSYYKQNGKPVLLSYFLNEFISAQQWSIIQRQVQKPHLLISDVLENPAGLRNLLKREGFDAGAMGAMAQAGDGLTASPLGSHRAWILRNFPRLASIAHANGKPFYWSVAPGYYRKDVAFIEPQFIYLDQTWKQAINSTDNNVIIYTWNDVNEDTDCWPSSNKGTALLELHSFYSNWFRTRKPPVIKQDLVFINYPTTNSGRRGPGGGENPTFPRLGYWAWLTKPARLELDGLGSVDLPKGQSIGHIAQVRPGLPAGFRLRRDGRAIFSGVVTKPMQEMPQGENLTYQWRALHKA